MKYLIIGTFALILVSCVIEKDYVYTEYIIRNNTQYSMTIEAYYINKKQNEIKISPQSSFVKNAVFDGRNADLSLFDITDTKVNTMRDSIVIIFDNKRLIKQACNGNRVISCPNTIKNLDDIIHSRNSLNNETYRKKGKRYIGPFEIVFTNDDYLRAVPF